MRIDNEPTGVRPTWYEMERESGYRYVGDVLNEELEARYQEDLKQH